MKKSTIKMGALIMAGTMALGLTACKKDDNPNTEPPETATMNFYERADYLARATDAHYATYEDDGELKVAAYYNALDGGAEGYANCYEYSSLIGMANRLYAASTDSAQKEFYKNLRDGYIDGLDYYDGTGYITSTHGRQQWAHIYGVPRSDEKFQNGVEGTLMVYDDLMWLMRYFVESYNYTGEEEYLEKAEYLTKCCLDGWDSTKGGVGGIPWGPGYATKHACSNGPIISVLGGLAEIYKDKNDVVTEEDTVFVAQSFGQGKVEWENMVGMKKYDYYLYWAKQVYDFCWINLRDSDYCFKDLRGDSNSVVKEDGALGGEYLVFRGTLDSGSAAKYTYNTGSMISGAAWLYRLTGDEQYLLQGRLMSEGAYNTFVKTVNVNGEDLQMYACTSSLLFNSVLMQGYLDLADAVKIKAPEAKDAIQSELANYVRVFKTSINYAFDNYLLNRTLPQNYLQGWLYSDKQTFDTHKDVKDAAATPEIMAMIVQYEASHGTL